MLARDARDVAIGIVLEPWEKGSGWVVELSLAWYGAIVALETLELAPAEAGVALSTAMASTDPEVRRVGELVREKLATGNGK